MLKIISKRIVARFLQNRGFILSKYGQNTLAPLQRFCTDAGVEHVEFTGQRFAIEQVFVQHLKSLLKCTDLDAFKIIESKALGKSTIQSLTQSIHLLLDNKVSPQTIIDYPFILAILTQRLKIRLMLLEAMHPRNINDFVPLMRMSLPVTNKVLNRYKVEAKFVPGRHRVYYFSDRLDLDPKLVSYYFSTHPFMFEIGWENLVENLNVLLSFNVEPLNIIKDLWAFKYLPTSIAARLERVKMAKKDKIMPWMVRCPEQVLQKTLQLTVDSHTLLAGNETVVDYLSERLGYHKDIMYHIVLKHPPVLRVRVTKIKDILDYLLNEAGFEPHHIAQVPRILCHGLETTKARLDELQTLFAYRPSTLVTLCKSRREYDKLLHALTETAERKSRFKSVKTKSA